ncbi:MAG: histidine phosphatase family protein [Anaerolineales bacterium]|nr:histidine phosphatase family protein [Anaerolineales bacterium]
MTNMVLIRHSISEPEATAPASQWRLSHRGRGRCEELAKRLAKYDLDLLVSSIEAKAIETAKLTAAHLSIPTEIALGIHEHERSNVGFLASPELFQAQVAELFDQPDEVVFGSESAVQALTRFTVAIDALIAAYGQESFGVVTHGTVMSLYVAELMGSAPFDLWQRLDMPAYVRIVLPQREVVEVVESLDL